MLFYLPVVWEAKANKEVVAIDPVSVQIGNFLMTIFCGLLMGVLFDGYRVVRGILTPRTIFTDIGDLMFWGVSTLVVFATLLVTNWGEVRLYVFLGLAIGIFVYLKLCSRTIIRILISAWRVSHTVCRWGTKFMHTMVWRPLRGMMHLFAMPFVWLYRRPGCYLIRGTRKIGGKCKARIKPLFYPRHPPAGPPG